MPYCPECGDKKYVDFVEIQEIFPQIHHNKYYCSRCSKYFFELDFETLADSGHEELGLQLDDIVHDLKNKEASDINNSGIVNQLEFVKDNCQTYEAFIELLAEETDLTLPNL